MPKFKFQVRTDTHVFLSEAADLPGTDEARVEASRRAGALLAEHAEEIWIDEHWRMDVTDEAGLILFVIELSAIRTPATKDRRHEGGRA